MRRFTLAFAAFVALTALPIGAANTPTSEPAEGQPTSWATLEKATDPEIVAIRNVLKFLLEDRRPTPVNAVTTLDSSDVQAQGQVRALEDRIRRLEMELARVRSKVDRIR